MSLTKQSRAISFALALFAVGLGSYVGVMAALERSASLNFSVVEPGKLMRSAQPRPGDLDYILEEYGLGTILVLRGSSERYERIWSGNHDVPMICLQMYADDPPSDLQISLFFDLMRGETIDLERYRDIIVKTIGIDRNLKAKRFDFPILIHCEGGADRTGVMVALYRMAFQGWDLGRAKLEMTRHLHIFPVHPALFDFLDEHGREINRFHGSRESAPKDNEEKP